ncbi:MAG: hypothetical protein ACTHJQ_25905 [Rhizobiaceae bacterium]
MTFQFIPGPSGQGLSDQDFLASALDQPLSLTSTAMDAIKGGVLDSFYLGTELRDTTLPQEPQSTQESIMQTAEGLLPLRLFSAIRGAKALTQQPSPLLSEDDYKASTYFREGVPWDKGMTEARAAALADAYDTNQVRSFYAQKRPITAFFGNLAGQAIDPINYVPIAGEAVAAANVARFGRIGGRALTASADAMANTAIAGLASAPVRAEFGDDVSWQTTLTQIGMAGLIGAAFGGVSGVIGRRADAKALTEATDSLSTLENVHKSRIALNDAIDGMVRDGEVRLSDTSAGYLTDTLSSLNPARSPNLFAPLERTDLYGTTAVGRLIDNRPVHVQDFETMVRNDVLSNNPDLAERYRAAEANFQAAQERAAAIEEPLNARTVADTAELIDPASADRLRAIEDDLAKSPSRAKTQALEAERETIVQSLGPDALAKAENDFRIGPTKQAKQARKALAAARQDFSKVRREADLIAASNVTVQRVRNMVPDMTVPQRAPEPAVAEAAKRVGKPEASREMAEQYRVHPETGDFPEMADIEQMRQSGRLTAEDEAGLSEAEDTFKQATGYGEALKAFSRCEI